MKTLDEVIKDLEKCMTDNAIESEGFYLATDSLFYLKEYRWILENCAETLAEKYPSENVPLTWDELQRMIGKPIWVEYEGYTPDWEIVEYVGNTKWKWGEVIETHLSILHKENQGKEWQAYRKERRNENAG